jgi:hypothetical protein
LGQNSVLLCGGASAGVDARLRGAETVSSDLTQRQRLNAMYLGHWVVVLGTPHVQQRSQTVGTLAATNRMLNGSRLVTTGEKAGHR